MSESRRAIALAIVALFALAVAGSLLGNGQALSQTPQDKIVFQCGSDICIMGPDGSGKVNLTQDQKYDINPELAPDGAHIVWACDFNQLCLMDWDGANQHYITPGTETSEEPSWSPDGSRLVYVCTSPVNFGHALCTNNTEGSDRQLIFDPGDAILQVRQPDWSPDGSKIAFQGNPLTFEHADDIFVVSSDGSSVNNLTDTPDRTERIAAWSPSGTKLAFYSSRPASEGGQSALYTMNPDGSDRQLLATPPNGASPSGVTWSPDGSQIAIECNVDDLCIMNANTGSLVRQLPSGDELWSTFHWGYAGGPPPLPIEDQIAACLPNVNVAYGRKNQAQQWTAFEPGAPAILQTLSEFVPGGGYLVNVDGNCTLTNGINTISLYTGWNLLGWRNSQGTGGVLIEAQLGTCLETTNVAYGHENQAKEWLAFEPGAPDFLQMLREFVSGGGYLVNTSASCTISSGANSVPVYYGWNLFGWE